MTITGGLIMTSAEQSMRHGSNFFKQTIAAAEQNNIPHHLLDANQIRKRFPQFKLQGNEKGYFEEKAGFLRPERCIEAQLELARRHGAKIAVNEQVISLTPTKDEVTIKTSKGVYIGAKAIIASGSWISHLIGERFTHLFRVFRQVLYWFEAAGSIRQFEMPNFPVWIWEFGTNAEDLMYGFPAIDGAGGGVKIAAEQYSTTTDPDIVSRAVSAQEIQNMYSKYVQPHIAGLSKKCVKAEACLYTVTPDHKFVLDVHPDYSNIIVASPCSGHGFKHSAAIGETLAELALEGKSKLDIRKFNFARFTNY